MKISNGVNKKMSFPIAIIIIIACAVLVGGIVVWQYGLSPEIFWENIPFPKRPVSEVTITTDKTEYEQGETIKITVENNLDRKINFKGYDPFYLDKKSDRNVWKPFNVIIYEIQHLLVRNEDYINSGEVKSFEKNIIGHGYEPGIYRVAFPICIKCRDSVAGDTKEVDEVIYSEEFEIKKTINCKQLYEEVENDFEKANFCEEDSDCRRIVLDDLHIEFGCFRYVNKGIDENALLEKVGEYGKKCSASTGTCKFFLEATCISRKCIYIGEAEKGITNWKTYRNEEYGFEIKYPKDYLIKEEKITHGLEEKQPPEYILSYKYDKPVWLLNTVEIDSSLFPPEGVEIRIDIWNNANNLTVNQWLDYINKGVDQGLIYEGRFVGIIESISITGIEAIKGGYGCCGACFEGIFIAKGDKVYSLALSGSAGTILNYIGYYGYSKKDSCYLGNKYLFDLILSTFRFLE